MVDALEVMPKGLQMPAGEAPISRKRAVAPRPDESRSWNFLEGVGPSAPPPASASPSYYQQPKPFKVGWKERRKEPSIQPAAQRHENDARAAARAETHAKLRFDILSDKRDYTGVDPIKGTVRDEVKAVTPSHGRRGVPERSVEVRVFFIISSVKPSALPLPPPSLRPPRIPWRARGSSLSSTTRDLRFTCVLHEVSGSTFLKIGKKNGEKCVPLVAFLVSDAPTHTFSARRAPPLLPSFTSPAQATEREARKAQSAEVRLTLKREVLVNEGPPRPQPRGARVRDVFDASLWNPRGAAGLSAGSSRASTAIATARVSSSRAATPSATATEVAEVRALP